MKTETAKKPPCGKIETIGWMPYERIPQVVNYQCLIQHFHILKDELKEDFISRHRSLLRSSSIAIRLKTYGNSYFSLMVKAIDMITKIPPEAIC